MGKALVGFSEGPGETRPHLYRLVEDGLVLRAPEPFTARLLEDLASS